MFKLVIIGAGSTVFVKNLVGDLLTYDELVIDKISLVDIDKYKLDIMEKLIKKMCKQEKKNIVIEAATDRREVLGDADYVVCTIDVGIVDLYEKELSIADKYGINQNVGDTVGPGGVFKGLRTIPVILEICKDIEELCPNAKFFNYSNPMCITMIAVKEFTDIEAYGLCHSVQGTQKQIADYIQVTLERMAFVCAGINHMAWFLKIEVDGEDIYPLLKDISKNSRTIKEISKNESIYSHYGVELIDYVRFEIMKHFGFFVSESPFHMSEYVPYFRKNEMQIKQLRVNNRWWLEHCINREVYFEEIKKIVNNDEKIKIEKSDEYLPEIIRSIETGRIFKANINLINNGLIANLPLKCCVEVPCFIDASGINPCYIGDLPEQCAALCRTNINVQMLAVRAVFEKNWDRKKEYIMQAIKVDPLTSSLLTLNEITEMVEELISLNKDFL